MDRAAIVEALREIARRLTLQGADQFRTRAYDRAADAIDDVLENLDTLVTEGRLTEIEGVGKTIAALVTEMHGTGKSQMLETLRAEMAPGILELADASRLSADKLKALREGLGITTAAELEDACRAHRVQRIKGFGGKTEEKILERLVRARTSPRRTILWDAQRAVDRVRRALSEEPGVRSVHAAGGVRRFMEVVGEIELVVETDDPAALRAKLSPRAGDDDAGGGIRIGLREGVPVIVWLARPEELGTALLRATGSPEHVRAVEALAAERGASVEGARTEEEIYERLGVPWVTPELRDGEDELRAAPSSLVTPAQIRGMVHCHTVYSDGKETIEAMARAAETMGCAYITITDHSANAHYARGLPVERLREQWDEIARVQEKVGIRILRGMEADILPTGDIDCPDDVMRELDVLIASIHVRAGMDVDQMTARVVKAMRHPCFKIWGHAFGRLLERRPPIDVRVEEILDAVAESRAAIEINSDPHRLDMEPKWVRAAAERGISFVVSTDAHSTSGMAWLGMGVGLARRARLGPERVLNTRTPDEFLRSVRPAS